MDDVRRAWHAQVKIKVGNFELVPYRRYTSSTIGKIILPVQPQ